jgi:hypothetical protein
MYHLNVSLREMPKAAEAIPGRKVECRYTIKIFSYIAFNLRSIFSDSKQESTFEMRYIAQRIIKNAFHKSNGSSMKFKLSGCFLSIFLLFSISTSLYAQWKKIADFGNGSSTFIRAVYFKEFTQIPQEGFLTAQNTTSPSTFWHTTDAGKTWSHETDLDGNNPACFSFKNSSEGWFSTWENGGIHYTKDGGLTWSPASPQFKTLSWDSSIYAYGISYVKSTNLVIGNTADENFTSYYFSSDGVHFYAGLKLPGLGGGISTTFSDGIHGILFSANRWPVLNTYAYTSDGGLNWTVASLWTEFYQPVGIEGTQTFFAISEAGQKAGVVIRSDNGGKTWKELYSYRSPGLASDNLTGSMQYGVNMTLFFQTGADSSQGIMMSEDSGITFHSICGPANNEDTKFYVRDSFIYAGDNHGGLWLNTTGIGSNSKPQLSETKISAPALLGCKKFDSVITFTFFDSCSNYQATLLSAYFRFTKFFILHCIGHSLHYSSE